MYSVHLIRHLVAREFQSRYAGSTLGVLWSLAIPLSQLMIFAFVFGKVVPLRIEHFPLFLFAALLPWNWFSSSMLTAGSIFIDSRNLLRNPNVSAATLVIARTIAQMLSLLLSLPVLLLMVLVYGLDFPWLFLASLPLLLLIQGVMLTGLSLMIATANAFYRDVSHLVGIVVSLLFFLTPIWYAAPASGPHAVLFDINPLSLLVQNYRQLVLEQQGIDWFALLGAAAWAAGLLLLGQWMHRRLEPEVLDAI